MKEKLNNIPPHWKSAKLGEVCEILDGKRKPVNADEREKRISGKNQNELFPYYGATGQVGFIDDYLLDGEYILLGEDGAPFLEPFKDKAYLVNGKIWVNNHAHILRSNYSNKFLCYYLNQISYHDFVTGTTRLKLNQSLMKEIPVIVPPLPEQHLIVSKIEELFSELDKSVEALKTAKQQLKKYRKSVLKWAFEGKLSAECRVKNAELAMAAEAQGKYGKQNNLPEGWKWVKFIDFCKLQRGYDLPLSKIIRGNYPVVTSAGINGYHNEFKANGPCLTTGRSGGVGNIYYVEIDNYWPHNTVLFVKDFCGNYPKFTYYFFKQFNFKSFSASTAVPTLDRKQLFNELVPVPPLKNQKQIVEQIETRFAQVDKLEESINESLQEAEALRQSILKMAFEGRLI